jgi:hypothetical protein
MVTIMVTYIKKGGKGKKFQPKELPSGRKYAKIEIQGRRS